jgi:hypothetical protein
MWAGHFTRHRGRRPRRRPRPPAKPAPRGGRVEPHRERRSTTLSPVLADIEKHIDQGIAHLTGRLEQTHVVAPIENGPAPSEDPVDRLGESDRDGLHAPTHRAPPRGLDDEVQVVSLDGVVDDAEVSLLAGDGEGALECSNETLVSEGRHVFPNA